MRIIAGCLFLGFVLISTAVSGGEKSLMNQKDPVWKGKKKIVVEEILRIGSDSIDDGSFFGWAGDMALDDEGHLYVVDFKRYRVAMFDREGKFIRNYGYGKGQGPGEFQRVGFVAVDPGHVYVGDENALRISVFDRANRFLRFFPFDLRPSGVMAALADRLYIGTLLLTSSLSQGVYQVYSVSTGKPIGAIGPWTEEEREKRRIWTGNSGLAIDRKGERIYVSHPGVCRIDCLTLQGKYLFSFGRHEADEFRILPKSDPSLGDIAAWGGSALVLVEDGILMHVNSHFSAERNGKGGFKYLAARRFDFYDGRGRYLLTVPEEIFGIEGRYVLRAVSDGKGNVWLNHSEPFRHIRKYRISFR